MVNSVFIVLIVVEKFGGFSDIVRYVQCIKSVI